MRIYMDVCCLCRPFDDQSQDKDIKATAEKYRLQNIKLFDSLHLAAAEYANVDALLTTDTEFINAATRAKSIIRVVNPLIFYMEVLSNE